MGKSTLFNRICGRRKAITDGRPGSTRDRNYAQVSWQGAGFELVDTGGLLLQTDDPLLGPAADQARLAIDESDRVLFVVDGRAGLLPDDAAIAKELRRRGKSVVLTVNKIEGSGDAALADFSSLGFGTMVPVSAEHGLGVGDLLDEVLLGLPRVEVPEETRPLRIALVGRPNVGKSSLLNKLLGQERSVVSAVPGTTRDSVDSLLVKGGKHYLFVDTAGIRRGRLLKEPVDYVSVVQSKKSIEHSDVAIVMLSAEDGLREMDAVIAGIVQEAGRGIVIAVNKWDLAADRKITQKFFSSRDRAASQVPPLGSGRLYVGEDGEGAYRRPRCGRSRAGPADPPDHHGRAQPDPSPRPAGVRPEGRKGQRAGQDPLRHPGGDSARPRSSSP